MLSTEIFEHQRSTQWQALQQYLTQFTLETKMTPIADRLRNDPVARGKSQQFKVNVDIREDVF